jgi:hypothetical protein
LRPASRIAFAVCACPLVLIAACGNSRTQVPAVQTGGSAPGFRMLSYPAAGISFRAPSDWSAANGQGPLIATLTSRTSVVALWRFPRNIDPPTGTTALRRARRQLILKARHRDPRLTLIRSTITAVSGVPAIEIDAFEQIAGQSRRVRSTHVFERRAEIVLDEYAPPQAFHAVDHAVFSPVKSSLLLSGTSTA